MKASLQMCTQVGTAGKAHCKVGKEYYVFWNAQGDIILDWVDAKVREFHPEVKGHNYSVVGVAHRTMDSFSVSPIMEDYILVHKKTFRKLLRRAVCKSLNRG